MCKGADFAYSIEGDVLTLNGTIKATTPDMLKGDMQLDPAYALFQGDGSYSFETSPHGTEGFYVLIPNRLDTPIVVEDLKLDFKVAMIAAVLSHPMEMMKQALAAGPIAGIVIAVIVSVLVLVFLAFWSGKKAGSKATAAAVSKAAGAGSVV